MKTLHRQVLLLSTAMLAACGGPAVSIATHSATSGPRAGDAGNAAVHPAHLWLQNGQSPDGSVTLLDATTGKTLASYPNGVASRDWSRMYVVTAQASQNLLKVVDPATGRDITVTTTDPGFALPTSGGGQRPAGLSPSGGHLVLAGASPSTPSPSTTSRFLVYDSNHLDRAPQRIALGGSFLFDGINDDGRNLYLLEDLSTPTTGGAYHVRRYDLIAGALDPTIIVDKRTGEKSISGTAIDSVNSRDGAWQFTVYGFGQMSPSPFVHALNLNDAIAFCIDLPSAPRDQVLDLLWGVAASHDGRFVYAVNSAHGSVVEMAADSPYQTRQATFPVPTPTSAAAWTPWTPVTVQAKRQVDGAAAISFDDHTLYSIGDAGVFVVDAARLRLTGSLLSKQALSSLILSGDGQRLYATSVDGAVLQVDVSTGRWASVTAGGAAVSVLRAQP